MSDTASPPSASAREVRFADDNLGVCVLTFDGRVVELFGENGTSSRLHVLMLTVDVREPDRKGRVVVDLAPVRRGHGAIRLVVSAEAPVALERILAEIRAAADITG